MRGGPATGVPVLLVVAAVVAACGQGDGAVTPEPRVGDGDPAVARNDRAQIQEVIDDYQAALRRRSGFGVCNEVSAAAAAAFGDGACVTAAEVALGQRKVRAVRRIQSEVEELAIAGQVARAIVRDAAGASYRVRFVNEGGGWKLAQTSLLDPSGLRPEGSR